MNPTAALAHSITWKSSKQSYLTALLLADHRLVDDCLCGYAYFRWADDVIDLASLSAAARQAFITRQKELIERLYRGERPLHLCPEETLLAELIAHDRNPESGLHSFIRNFMAVIAFDAGRGGRFISRRELTAYTTCLSVAVMDGLLYFIGNGCSYPHTPDRNMAVVGAHITHMLRDLLEDLPRGIINIPAEDMVRCSLCLEARGTPAFRLWVRDQVLRARQCFQQGKRYVDSLNCLRAKLAGAWYCARFEIILDAIERDGYHLRAGYAERHSWKTWVKMLALAVVVTARHVHAQIRQAFIRRSGPSYQPRSSVV